MHGIASLFAAIVADGDSKGDQRIAAGAGVLGGIGEALTSALISVGVRIGGARAAYGFWVGSELMHCVNALQQSAIHFTAFSDGIPALQASAVTAGFAGIAYAVLGLALIRYSSLFVDPVTLPRAEETSDRVRLNRLTRA